MMSEYFSIMPTCFTHHSPLTTHHQLYTGFFLSRCLSFHISLNVLSLNSSVALCCDQPFIKPLTTLFFMLALAIFIMRRLKLACFQSFQATRSDTEASPSTTDSYLFSSNSSCRLILTGQTSVQLPHKDEA